MKERKAYQILQELVINAPDISIADKTDLLRLLFEREDLALYIEEHEKQEGGEDESV